MIACFFVLLYQSGSICDIMFLEEDLRQWPYVRLLIPFVAGILFQVSFPIPQAWVLGLFLLSNAMLLSLFIWQHISPDYHRRWFFGASLYLLLFISGSALLSLNMNRINFTHFDMGNNEFVAIVTEAPEEKPRSFKIILDIERIKSNEGWIKTRGKALVYLEKDSLAEKLFIGDQLAVRGNFQEIRFNNNPQEFDYRSYLSRQGVYCQMYLRSENWKQIADKRKISLTLFAEKTRYALLKIYEKFQFGEEELAIAGALTLGFREKIDPELRDLYVNAGVMHVLAISGLHVGIIYFLLFHILGFLKKIRRGMILRALIIILLLWFFAFLTGLSPSVMRAATMFSFITIGQSLKRPGNIFNTIAASAFFLLLINPYLIKEIGFQLSYTAVTGIVFFQPRFYRLFRSRFWIVDKAWGLVTVSLAAQLSTFPISTFYFHQFPNYFILSNIVVIPFVTIILYLGILVFTFSFLPAIAGILAWVMNQSIGILNAILGGITNLPHAVTEGISNTFTETILLYVLIITFSFFIIQKKNRYVFYFIGSLILFLSFKTYSNVKTKHQKMIVVYNVESTTAIGFIDGNRAWLVSDLDETNSQEKLDYYVSNHFNRLKIDELNYINLKSSENETMVVDLSGHDPGFLRRGNFIYFYGNKICLIDSSWPDAHPNGNPYDFDYVVLRHNPDLDQAGFFKNFQVRQVILDSSVSFYFEEILKEKCTKIGIPCYSVRFQGALIHDLKKMH